MSWKHTRCITHAILLVTLLINAITAEAQVVHEPEFEWPSCKTPDFFDDGRQDAVPGLVDEVRDDRIVAGLWSVLIPGAGQFYRGERSKGAVMLGGFLGSLGYAVFAGMGKDEICATGPAGSACVEASHQPNRHLAIGLGAAVGFHVWSVLDALAPREPQR